MSTKTKIGLFGFGCVGQGLYHILEKNPHFNAEVSKICVKNRKKQRTLPVERFTYQKNEILEDDSIQLIVELINHADEALQIVREALMRKKTVVTANKKMIAENYQDLFDLQYQYGGSLLYEASSCGSIPIIRNLEEYFDNEPLNSVYGIFNGSSNYILSKIFNENKTYESALHEAQKLGFAELDPTLDVGGFDAANKLVIITAHAFGTIVRPDDIFTIGIQSLKGEDVAFAMDNSLKIKSLSMAITFDNLVTGMVIPVLVDKSHELHDIENEDNAVIVSGKFSGNQLLKGKGAGGLPTGSAVLSDISASNYGYRYEYKKHLKTNQLQFSNNLNFDLYISFTNEKLLDMIRVNKVWQIQKYHSHYKALVDINLQHLIQHQSLLKESDVFLAAYNLPFQKSMSLNLPKKQEALQA